MGVIPTSGFVAVAHDFPWVRLSSANRHNAERSFCWARGIPNSPSTRRASAILFRSAIERRYLLIDQFLRKRPLYLRPPAKFFQIPAARESEETEIRHIANPRGASPSMPLWRE